MDSTPFAEDRSSNFVCGTVFAKLMTIRFMVLSKLKTQLRGSYPSKAVIKYALSAPCACLHKPNVVVLIHTLLRYEAILSLLINFEARCIACEAYALYHAEQQIFRDMRCTAQSHASVRLDRVETYVIHLI